ncbi:MAG: hypothetical protein Ta2D_05000 [Rickettsiales bacterium]|nr:MAG: hypothetical protein Ta2D_05000 [Rickettsiales bacterium]
MKNVLKIIYEKIVAHNSDDFSQLTGIFTCVPSNQKLPYIVITIVKANNISNFVEEIFLYDIKISVYTENNSNIFLLNVLNEIRDTIFDCEDFINIKEIETNIENQSNDILCGNIIFNIVY